MKPIQGLPILLLAMQLTGCAATGKKRLALGSIYGGTIGALGGTVLSPNDESRGINALVFGLSGALAGGMLALFTDTDTSSTQTSTLKDRESGSSTSLREFPILPNQELPEFLKKRVQPVVIEEYLETDRVTEEGTLHEPHKAYRIKHPAELFARPSEPVMPKASATQTSQP